MMSVCGVCVFCVACVCCVLCVVLLFCCLLSSTRPADIFLQIHRLHQYFSGMFRMNREPSSLVDCDC